MHTVVAQGLTYSEHDGGVLRLVEYTRTSWWGPLAGVTSDTFEHDRR